MLTGVIQPLPKTQRLDRSDVSHTLWEQNAKPNPVNLPWRPAASCDAGYVQDLLSSASTLVLAGSRVELYEHVIATLRPGIRMYAYGSPGMETDRRLLKALAKAGDQMVVRLGHELPADWIVVDGGRAGVLLVGPPGEAPRWAIPLGAGLARSLFDVFSILFWFHSRRERLPDSAGLPAFRSPLPSPYRDVGTDVQLPAGRLVIDRPLPDPVPDAEFRIVPDGTTPGRAATVLVPPNTDAFDAARLVAAAGTRLLWTDTGLPRTTISRQRLVMDLISGPVGIQLQWDAGAAVDAFHCINKACEAPQWTFHAQRRLRDIAGLVLLERASGPAPVEAEERIDLPDLRSKLATLEAAEPKDLRSPSPLAKSVLYMWRTVPEVVPAGAGKAQIVRQWTALNEWATRSVAILRQRLSSMEGEERSFLGRLKGLMRGHTAVQQERMRILDALSEIGEQPPSQRSDAEEAVRRLVEEGGKIHGLLKQAHVERQKAEDDAEESEQREAWRAHVEQAAKELVESRAALSKLEDRQMTADAEVRDAEVAILHRTSELRTAKLARLTEDRGRDETALAETKTQLEQLDARHRGGAPKAERKPLTLAIARLEQLVAASKRELLATEKEAWIPAAPDLKEEAGRMKQARDEQEAVRKELASLTSDLARLERAAGEDFAYRPGPRLPDVSLPDIATAPAIPTEAPPELGELFEFQGRRFLAVHTWEQVTRATRVALRLQAELVAFPDSTK